MFLICREKGTCARTLAKLTSAMHEIPCGAIQYVKLRDYWLGWSRCKTHENLHTFDDGILVGKLTFAEKPQDSEVLHAGNMPDEVPPLSTGTRVLTGGGGILVEPFNVTNIFYGEDSVSDMQLLIAEAEGHLPSPEGISVLSTVGYFPGNITLFREIRKIPFRASYNLASHQLSAPKSIPYRGPNDDEMIARLKAIVPDHPRQYLGMSAGYDSRFVLGILALAGATPHLVHVRGDETDLVLQLANQLDLKYSIVENLKSNLLSPETYTLMSDAQIYFRGGNYSGARDCMGKESLYHLGSFADSIVKNAYAGVTKYPGPIGRFFEKLVEHVSLSGCEKQVDGLREFNTKESLKRYLLRELAFGNDYCPFRTKKEWANWYHYLHRAIRWIAAFTADLGYFTQPIFLLSDLMATTLGIAASAWDNINCNRLRELNLSLLRGLPVVYYDGRHYLPDRGLAGLWKKTRSAFLNRESLMAYLFGHTNPANLRESRGRMIAEDVCHRSQEFSRYFTDGLAEIIQSPKYTYSLKRAAVTVGYALQFLRA